MKWLKKFVVIIYVLALLGVMVFALSNEAILSIISNLSKSDNGILVPVAAYFKDADTWNYIFLFLFLAVSISLFMGINVLLNKGMNWLGGKYTKLSFLKSWWADYTIQYPGSIILLAVLFFMGTNIYVPFFASKHTVESISDIEKPMPVFVLGTAKMLSSGKGENVYYRQRITAANDLYKGGKVTYFLLSGDGGMGRTDGYSETRDMRNDLLALGIPDEKIKIDTAGFRTLDSMLRLRALFKLNDIIIVSQAFHTPRAVLLGEFYGLHCIAYNSKGSATSSMLVRELGSRPRMIMDLIFFNMQPKVTNSEGDALEYREAFEAKSDLHVLLLVGTFGLVFIMAMGYGVYTNSKNAEDRKKAAKKYSLIGASVTAVLVVIVFSVYKNLDIKFVDEVVETFAKTVGVKTEKMEVKRELKEKVIEKIKQEQTASITTPVITTAVTTDLPVEEKPKATEFNTAETTTQPTKAETTTASVKEEVKKEEDLFNTAEGADSDVFGEKTESTVKKTKQYFKAVVYRSTTVKHDGVVSLQLSEAVNIGGKVIPANHIFEGKTILYNNRFIIVADLEDSEVKNYESGKEGNAIQARHQSKKGEVVLAEGEALTFGF